MRTVPHSSSGKKISVREKDVCDSPWPMDWPGRKLHVWSGPKDSELRWSHRPLLHMFAILWLCVGETVSFLKDGDVQLLS